MNAVVRVEQHEPPSVIATMAQRFGMDKRAFESTLRATIMPKDCSSEQVAAFLVVAQQYDLNPFTKEIFAFPSRGGIQPIVSVDGWMKLINSHPQFDGMEFYDHFGDDGKLISIMCKMFRKDRAHAVEVTEYMSECYRDTETWKRWPARMLRHKAAIQTARYAFGFAGIMEPDEVERMVEANVVDDGIPPALVIADERKARCDAAAEQYAQAIEYIKAKIAENDLESVRKEWNNIPQAAQMDLWLAPTKGGIFTTHERDIIHNKLPHRTREETASDEG